MTESQTSMRKAGAAVLLGLAVALLALAGSASAAGSQTYGSCAGAVISDWLQNEPNVVGHYPIHCYRDAISQLNSYPDVKDYSNAADDIRRAELAEVRYQQTHPDTGPGTTTNQGGSAPPPGNNGGGNKGGGGKSLITRIFDSVGPGSAQSVPLPLLILAGLAVLLLLAAAGTWIAKRIQARKLAPAPARAPGPGRH